MPKTNAARSTATTKPTTNPRGDCAACGKRRVLPFTSNRYGGDVCATCHDDEGRMDDNDADHAASDATREVAPLIITGRAAETATLAPGADPFADVAPTPIVATPESLANGTTAAAMKSKRAALPSAFILPTAYEVAKGAGADMLVAMRGVLAKVPEGQRRSLIAKSRTKVQPGSPVDEALKTLHNDIPVATASTSERVRGPKDVVRVQRTGNNNVFIRLTLPAELRDAKSLSIAIVDGKCILTPMK